MVVVDVVDTGGATVVEVVETGGAVGSHAHVAVQAWPAGQSVSVSHCSPRPASTVRSPQRERLAANGRFLGFDRLAMIVPSMLSHVVGLIRARSFTRPTRPPHLFHLPSTRVPALVGTDRRTPGPEQMSPIEMVRSPMITASSVGGEMPKTSC